MKIFRVKRQVNLILAVLFAFATIPVGAFVKLVSLMFAVLSIYAVGAFGLLFFFGIIYIILERFGTWGFTRSTQYHELHLEHKYNQLRRWLLETFRDLSSHRNDEIAKEIKKVENWLTSGEQKYNTDARQGVQYLEGKASYLYGFLRKRHALVSEPPS